MTLRPGPVCVADAGARCPRISGHPLSNPHARLAPNCQPERDAEIRLAPQQTSLDARHRRASLLLEWRRQAGRGRRPASSGRSQRSRPAWRRFALSRIRRRGRRLRHSAGKATSLRARWMAAGEPLSSTPWSAQRNSTVGIRRPISACSSTASPTTRSTASATRPLEPTAQQHLSRGKPPRP